MAQQFDDMDFQQGGGGGQDFLLQLSMHAAFSFVRRSVLSPLFRVSMLTTVEHELVRQSLIGTTGFGGMLGCVKHIFVLEGASAYWRGLLTDAVLAIPASITEEIATDIVNSQLFNIVGPRAGDLSQGTLLAISMGATAVLSQITAIVNEPIQTVMTCYMGDVAGPAESENPTFQFTGPVATAKAIYQKNGLGGFFRGVSLNMLSSVAYRGAYFGAMHMFMLLSSEASQSKYGMLVARLLSLVAGVVAQPVEVVRRRLMRTATTEKKYAGVIDCVKTILKEEGALGLFAGLKVRLVMTGAGFIVGLLTANAEQ
eukprot:CAMPEP_0176442016 /NCGR_PEP_ID=MMETSP0127-20121128/21559_1 /TAXON_ID=938130 /ORGANISM="Platyophrya macrostoma, Strain WH" /LENGTH=312 /DNA_ID=CAMNT_0017826939 /DNA_START=27 /DNA_END=965 /DNA_ORIENTATION=-